MAVKPGYKESEVGVIPEEWGVSKVGNEFDIKLGKMLDSGKNVGVPKPYLGNKAVQWGRIDLSDLPTVPLTPTDIERFRLRDGDLLVCEGGEVGRAALWNSPIDECYYQKALHRLRPISGFDSRLMAALLRQWADSGGLANYVTQTSIAHLPREKFMDVPMPVPPVAEQRAIATALSDVDALLGALEQFISKKRDLKQATMQQLLTGQTRLPGFHGDWQVKVLGDLISSCSSGATPRRDQPDFYRGDIRWITSGELNYSVIRDTVEKITSEAVAKTNLKVIPKGTFLMAITGLEAAGTRGSCAIVGEPSTTNQSCMAIFPTSELLTEYLFHYYVFRGDALALQYCQGSKQQSYTAKLVRKLPISVPPTTEEQAAIATVLSDMDAELAALEQRLAKTRALKQGMMQELLTGRTRLL